MPPPHHEAETGQAHGRHPQADTGEAPLRRHRPPSVAICSPWLCSAPFSFSEKKFSFPGWGWEAALLLGGARALSLGRAAQLTTGPWAPEPTHGQAQAAHLQMEPSSAETEATAQLEPDWGSGREEEGMGVPGTSRRPAPESRLILVRATPHEECFHFTRKIRAQSRKRISSCLHPLSGS